MRFLQFYKQQASSSRVIHVNVEKVLNDLKWRIRILCPIRFRILENYQDTAESRFWVARLLIV
jgi:hypothetical protein